MIQDGSVSKFPMAIMLQDPHLLRIICPKFLEFEIRKVRDFFSYMSPTTQTRRYGKESSNSILEDNLERGRKAGPSNFMQLSHLSSKLTNI